MEYKMGKMKELLYDEEHGKYRDIEEFMNEDSIAAFEAQVEEKEEEANEEELS